MNVKLLRELQEMFKKNPKCLDMGDWVYHNDCGTVGCIAGWASMITHMREFKVSCEIACDDVANPRNEGKKALELNEDQCEALFYTTHWPEDLQDKYNEAKNRKERSAVTVERIDRFIESGGTDGIDTGY